MIPLILMAVVASATTVVGFLHVKFSLDGTYVRWAEESVSTDRRNSTEKETHVHDHAVQEPGDTLRRS